MLDPETTVVFQKAAELGIHRTVHAGEAGPALMVLKVNSTYLRAFSHVIYRKYVLAHRH